MKRTRIRQHEIGLWFRDGDFRKLLLPGTYLVGRFFWRDRVEVIDTMQTLFEHRQLEVLLQSGDVREHVTVVDLVDDQRALVWRNGRLAHFLGPGRHALWSQPFHIEVEVFDVTEPRLRHAKMEALLAHRDAAKFLQAVHTEHREHTVFFRGGRVIDVAESGPAVFWRLETAVTWRTVDLREQTLDVAGQEILTADRVTLRANLMLTYVVTDPLEALTAVSDFEQALYREAQLALRAAVGGRVLDKVLADKEALGVEIQSTVADRVAGMGIAVRGVGLRDVILPGEMRTILNRVIEAQKEAEANLIRRREETAAARSQANTARLLAENPVLARLKELEALQAILAGTKATFVFGRGDLVHQVAELAAGDETARGE
ncbi:MAG: slipin family protein [bacterium]|nr:slipin family protein [bacterium]